MASEALERVDGGRASSDSSQGSRKSAIHFTLVNALAISPTKCTDAGGADVMMQSTFSLRIRRTAVHADSRAQVFVRQEER